MTQLKCFGVEAPEVELEKEPPVRPCPTAQFKTHENDTGSSPLQIALYTKVRRCRMHR